MAIDPNQLQQDPNTDFGYAYDPISGTYGGAAGDPAYTAGGPDPTLDSGNDVSYDPTQDYNQNQDTSQDTSQDFNAYDPSSYTPNYSDPNAGYDPGQSSADLTQQDTPQYLGYDAAGNPMLPDSSQQFLAQIGNFQDPTQGLATPDYTNPNYYGGVGLVMPWDNTSPVLGTQFYDPYSGQMQDTSNYDPYGGGF